MKILNRLFWLLVFLGIGFIVLFFIQYTLAKKSEARTNPKVNICHATHSENNPYRAIRVDDDGHWNGHDEHEEDFLYEGEVRENGHPVRDGDEWCEENAPNGDDGNHDEDGEDGQEATPSATIDEG